MSRLVVAVDLDGTLAQHNEVTCKYIREKYGVEYYPEDISDWNCDIPGTGVDMSKVIGELTNEEWYYSEMTPLPGAVEALQKWADHPNIYVVIATHRPDHITKVNKDWLKKWNIPYDEYEGEAPRNKGYVEADLLIDDYHVNVENAVNQGLDGILILHPFNIESVPAHEQVFTALNYLPNTETSLLVNKHLQWEWIGEFVCELADEKTA